MARKTTETTINDDDDDDDAHAASADSGIVDEGDASSSYDDNDNENDSTDDDDDDDEDETWLETFRSICISSTSSTLWRQHWVAVVVAILITIVSFYYPPFTNNSRQQQHRRTNRKRLSYQHSYQHQHQRTSNISFCGALQQSAAAAGEATGGDAVTDTTPKEAEAKAKALGLEILDFNVPKNLMDVMEAHFVADQSQQESSATQTATATQTHPEVTCLRNLKQQALSAHRHAFIKGITYYYKTPSLESMYNMEYNKGVSPASEPFSEPLLSRQEPVELAFTGFAAKFINLTPQPVLLHWDGRAGIAASRLIGELAPFEALTTATSRSGEAFFVSPVYDQSDALARWTVTLEDSIVYYEGSGSTTTTTTLTPEQELHYKMQLLNREFAKHYLIHSKRHWLSNFPRQFPVHAMWSADYFGQVHSVLAAAAPPATTPPTPNEETISRLSLQVVSVTPRVFIVRHFLSPTECEALQQLALQQGLKESTLYAGSRPSAASSSSSQPPLLQDRTTRSSSHAWISRTPTAHPVVDRFYRRAARLMQIDDNEQRFMPSQSYDDDDDDNEHSVVAESLQVLRYREGEAYAPHHDWVVSAPHHRHQPTRWATLLVYLNDDFEGGRTIFPRSINAQQNKDGLRVEPEQGMAVLFYNMLPDGNVDDLSQHGSEPVTRGEKFAANLWVWDPVIN